LERRSSQRTRVVGDSPAIPSDGAVEGGTTTRIAGSANTEEKPLGTGHRRTGASTPRRAGATIAELLQARDECGRSSCVVEGLTCRTARCGCRMQQRVTDTPGRSSSSQPRIRWQTELVATGAAGGGSEPNAYARTRHPWPDTWGRPALTVESGMNPVPACQADRHGREVGRSPYASHGEDPEGNHRRNPGLVMPMGAPGSDKADSSPRIGGAPFRCQQGCRLVDSRTRPVSREATGPASRSRHRPVLLDEEDVAPQSRIVGTMSRCAHDQRARQSRGGRAVEEQSVGRIINRRPDRQHR